MNETPEIGTKFEQPGFRGEVIGFLSGLMVIEAQLNGTIPAHAADRDEFAVVIEGEVIVTVDGQSSTIGAGQSMIVPAGKMHEVTTLKPAKVLLIG
jgi:quercetin dioxygenase-like cupin family protein